MTLRNEDIAVGQSWQVRAGGPKVRITGFFNEHEDCPMPVMVSYSTSSTNDNRCEFLATFKAKADRSLEPGDYAVDMVLPKFSVSFKGDGDDFPPQVDEHGLHYLFYANDGTKQEVRDAAKKLISDLFLAQFCKCAGMSTRERTANAGIPWSEARAGHDERDFLDSIGFNYVGRLAGPNSIHAVYGNRTAKGHLIAPLVALASALRHMTRRIGIDTDHLALLVAKQFFDAAYDRFLAFDRLPSMFRCAIDVHDGAEALRIWIPGILVNQAGASSWLVIDFSNNKRTITGDKWITDTLGGLYDLDHLIQGVA